MTAQALWFTGPKESVIKDTPLPELEDGFVRIRSSYSAISPGTERLVFQGKVPPSMVKKMIVPYMEGDFSFPVKYGYSIVGTVVDSPQDEFIGKRVHVMHPHQNEIVVRQEDLNFISDTLPDQRATLFSNTQTCVNAIWDSQVDIGDKVLIVGFGTIGSLLSLILQQMNLVEIHVADNNIEKLKIAEQFGFTTFSPNQVTPDFYDLSFHCSATSEGLQTAIDCVGLEGRVIELSWYGSNSVNLELGSSFHTGRKQIISSQVSRIPIRKQPQWDHYRRNEFVQKILHDTEFDKLITSTINFSSVSEIFEEITRPDRIDLSLVIDYR